MTVMGKILTLLVFFMSLVFMGFAFTINMTNKDPQSKKAFPEIVKDLREADAAKDKVIDELRREINKLKSDHASRDNEVQSVKNRFEAEIAALKKQHNDLIAAKDAAVSNFEKAQTEARALETQLEIRRQEVVAKDNTIRDRDKTVADQIAQIAKLNNQIIQHKVKADTYAERLQKVEADLKQITILYENLQEGITAKPGAGGPGAIAAPPDDVQGTVVKVVDNGRLLSINIGSDQGLRKGHEMFIFRMDPSPEYLGKIRIEEVGPHEAVGKLLAPNMNKKIKEKDIVASKILGGK